MESIIYDVSGIINLALSLQNHTNFSIKACVDNEFTSKINKHETAY